jgi:hypothetical protein
MLSPVFRGADADRCPAGAICWRSCSPTVRNVNSRHSRQTTTSGQIGNGRRPVLLLTGPRAARGSVPTRLQARGERNSHRSRNRHERITWSEIQGIESVTAARILCWCRVDDMGRV